ncbi:MAG: hypothetical protein F7B18_07295 [Desulfurococcales archaeon]|nr:hypothetical protein [Desulfurococcales archaeon]
MAEDVTWIQPLLLMIALGTVIMLTLKQARELKKLQEASNSKEKIITLIDCNGEKKERDFKEGDYIGKRVEECSDGDGIIIGIYAVKEEAKDKAKTKTSRTR